MLETRLPPPTSRTRRPDDVPRPVTRTTRTPRTLGSAALAPERVPPAANPEPSRRSPRTDRAARARLARSEMRLMGLATICTAVVCGLLLLYLAAYAQVTRLGIAQAEARVALRQNRLQNEMLRAESDRLQSPATVIARATALGMTPRGAARVDYLPVPSKTTAPTGTQNKSEDQSTEGDRMRGGSSGEADITSFGH